MPTKNKQFIVYPGEWATDIIGKRIPDSNRAIECWAHLYDEAKSEIEPLFSPQDFRVIRKARAGKLDPRSASGAALAILTGGHTDDSELLDKLRGLTYPQCWAVIDAAMEDV